MACIKCRKFREHPFSINCWKILYATIQTALPPHIAVAIEVKGQRKVQRQQMLTNADGYVMLTFGSWISDLPAYWHIPYSIKIYRLDRPNEPVQWQDELGTYNEIRFRTTLGPNHADGVILNEGAILSEV